MMMNRNLRGWGYRPAPFVPLMGPFLLGPVLLGLLLNPWVWLFGWLFSSRRRAGGGLLTFLLILLLIRPFF